MAPTIIVASWAVLSLVLLVLNHWRAGHRHAWDPVNVQATSSGLLFPAVPQTVVLLRCRCRMVSTETLTGHWTLEQVTGVTAGE